ncbi:MAG: DUF1707 domain-containing protein [Nocardioides sp.]
MPGDDLTSSTALWAAFAHDPRDRSHAALRASDADRDLAARVLSAAYADGRLDRSEHDQRAGAAAAARTLGELPGLISDLVPATSPRRTADPIVAATSAQLRSRAVEAWEERRRNAVFGFLAPSLICWAIYLALSDGAMTGFPWPLIVMAVTGAHLLRILTSAAEIRRDELRRLERQQAKALRKGSWRA